MISVLVPTRGRPAALSALLQSYVETTRDDAARSELIFRVDDDDPATWRVLRGAPHRVFIGPRLDGYASLPIFFNQLADLAVGSVVMCGNDDMIFRTPEWATRILEAVEAYPDGVYDLGVDTHNADVFPFSIVSRLAVAALGGVHDPRLYWGDVYLRDIMRAFGRAHRLPGVLIDHAWAGHAPDQTFREAHQEDPSHWDPTYWALHAQIVAEAVARLQPLVRRPC